MTLMVAKRTRGTTACCAARSLRLSRRTEHERVIVRAIGIVGCSWRHHTWILLITVVALETGVMLTRLLQL